MRTFKEFPADQVCPVCGLNTPAECVLVDIDGTQEEGIMQAAPVHTECLQNELLFCKDLKMIIAVAKH